MPLRVLLLDDDLVFASEARTAFVAAGCEVEVHDDGSTGILRAGEQRPDVVIASAELPGINGFRLCTRLKKAHEGLAVILTFSESSTSGVASHQRLVSRADAYIPRSVALHELVTRARSLARSSRADSPTSSRRKTGAPSSRPRSRTPAKSTGLRSVRPHAAASTVARAPAPLPPPPVPGKGGAPRPDSASHAERDQLRRTATSANAERDELARTLQAARTDAEALRGALDQARAEILKVQAEADASARALAGAKAESLVLGAALAAASRERNEHAEALEVGQGHIARLEQQLTDAEARAVPLPPVDPRIAILQRSSDAARLEREESRRELTIERARVAELESALKVEQVARAQADAKRELSITDDELTSGSDPATVEGRVQAAIDQARREHALEMTRLRGEHAGVVFQLRHELAVLRGTARASIIKPTPPQGMRSVRGGGTADVGTLEQAERHHNDVMEALKAKHQKELDATRSNVMVMMRRVEALEAQLEAAGSQDSGEHPTVAAGRPALRGKTR